MLKSNVAGTLVGVRRGGQSRRGGEEGLRVGGVDEVHEPLCAWCHFGGYRPGGVHGLWVCGRVDADGEVEVDKRLAGALESWSRRWPLGGVVGSSVPGADVGSRPHCYPPLRRPNGPVVGSQ